MRIKVAARAAFALPVLTLALQAQDELTLRRFFEGKRVRVKIDMPATHEGVDFRYRQDPPLDFRAYSDRLRKFGIALRNGDETMVTGVKLKSRNVEFQLAGGGYGTLGDDTGYVAMPSVSKSSREKQLEKDVKNETDNRRRERLQGELNRLRDQRQREERYEREEAARLTVARKAEIEQKRLQAGSRFNLWFPPNYLKEAAPSPAELMEMLSEWVDFSGLR